MAEDNQYGELALVVGDLHIPFRASDIPTAFKELLLPNKVDYVFCTGNVGSRETLDYLKGLSSQFHIVKGDFDDDTNLPDQKTLNVGQWKLTLTHGHQIIPWGDDESLYNLARETDSDLIISGHTHSMKASKLDNKFFINPGSCTGAYSPLKSDVVPTFLILEFKENELAVYQYSFVNGDVKVGNEQFTKSK